MLTPFYVNFSISLPCLMESWCVSVLEVHTTIYRDWETLLDEFATLRSSNRIWMEMENELGDIPEKIIPFFSIQKPHNVIALCTPKMLFANVIIKGGFERHRVAAIY